MGARHVTIICGFSGIGKSHAATRGKIYVDHESSPFSRKDGMTRIDDEKTRKREFAKNYLAFLSALVADRPDRIYLLSCHEEVREKLREYGIKYVIVLPRRNLKNEYLQRWLKRGSPIEFIESMYNRWDEMHDSCEADPAPKIYLESGEYLYDILPTKENNLGDAYIFPKSSKAILRGEEKQ